MSSFGVIWRLREREADTENPGVVILFFYISPLFFHAQCIALLLGALFYGLIEMTIEM